MLIMTQKIFNQTIEKSDLNHFFNWIKNQSAFLKENNFLTEFYNVVYDKNPLQPHSIEFLFYNYNVLDSKYQFSYPKLTNLLIEANFENPKLFVITTLNLLLPNQTEIIDSFKVFYNKLYDYYQDNNLKNWDYEYFLMQLYWKFIINLRKYDDKYYNRYLIVINKAIYSEQKGFKK